MAIDKAALVDSFVQIEMPVNDVVQMDSSYTDAVIDGQGILLEHWRCFLCPIGKNDAFDVRSAHADHTSCSNGYLYEYGGIITALFVGNSKNLQTLDMGFITGASVQITIPRHYTNDRSKEVVMGVLDRIYLKTVNPLNVVAAQIFEHNASGMDRLKYPINNVEMIIDSHNRRYFQDQDFRLVNGQVAWQGINRPGMDPETGKGEVCSIRYRYTPYWYVSNLVHEIRVIRNGDSVERTPMTAILQRENVFENEQNNANSRFGADADAGNQRQATAPRSGSFGPR